MPDIDESRETSVDWLPSTIYLIDQSPNLVGAWREAFSDCPAIQVLAGDYFQQTADAIVSPANSFGIMDGGLDLAIRNQLGYAVQSRLQELIVLKHHGELPVGSAEIISTNHQRWRYLIAAPTMRVPEPVAHTINAYLAFRAALTAVENFNRACEQREIDSLVCAGLGTGVGNMNALRCGRQMRAAYSVLKWPSGIPSPEEIHEFHRSLMRT